MSDDDVTSLLAARERARPNRWTWVLLALILVVGGLAGGVALGRATAPSPSPAFPGGFAGGFAGGFPGGFPGARGGSSGDGSAGAGLSTAPVASDAHTGTVTLIDGPHLYLTDSSGGVIKVTVGDSAVVASEQKVALADLPVGSTVTVSGPTGADGTVMASSVVERPSSDAASPGRSTGTVPAPAPTQEFPSPQPSTSKGASS